MDTRKYHSSFNIIKSEVDKLRSTEANIIILDATADASVLGKNTGVDAVRNKTTFLTFMTIDQAYAYAKKLTEEAKTCVSVFENESLLCELADYLLYRNK